MARWRRITGIVGIAAGATAAGAGAILAAERLAASRLRLSPDAALGEPLGELRGREFTAFAPDGVALHIEVNGPDDAPLTIVFCHGYALHQDCWHYQRRDLAGAGRLVFWDQRGHGRSGRGSGEPPVTVNQTGEDLAAVLAAVAPGRTRVVLVGHSMGGMTIMALAAGHPGLFGGKIAGVALIATAAGGLSSPDGLVPWLPGPLRTFLQKSAPGLLHSAAVGPRAALVEGGRLMSRELELIATRFLAFGDPQASLTQTEFLERMIREAPVGVLAEFYSALLSSDQRAALSVLGRVPVAVVTGDRDRLIPSRLGTELAAEIPGARLTLVPGAGHAVMMERPDVVNEAIVSLLSEVEAGRPARRLLSRRRGEKGERGVA